MTETPTTTGTSRPRAARMADPLKVDRLPPSSESAEAAVLGCILLDADHAMPLCLEALPEPDAFYDLRNRVLYEQMLALYDQRLPINVITLMQRLRDRQQLEAVGGMSYLSALPDAAPSVAMVDYFLAILQEKHRLRKLIQLCTETVGQCYESPEAKTVFEEAEGQFSKFLLGQAAGSPLLPIRELVHQAIDKFEQYHRNQGVLLGLSTGLIDLDKLTGGLQEGLYIIAARTSIGKTSIALNIADHVAVNLKVPVGIFSLEMSALSLVIRLMCSRARVNMRLVRDGFMAENYFPKLTSAAGKIAASPLYIDDTPALPLAQLRARARRWQQMHGIKLLVVDYLQLLVSSRRNASRVEQVTELSGGCKALSKELHIPVIVLAQLNRELEKTQRAPRMSDLRESGSCEADADVIGLLYRPPSEGGKSESAEAIAVNLDIAKNRDGPTGEIPLTFLKGFTKFQSAAKIDPDLPNYDHD